VDSRSERDPGVAGGVSGLTHEVPGGRNRLCRVIGAGEAGDEEGYRLVPDELVDDAVPPVNHARRRAVKAREQLAERAWGRPLGHPR
jgi:hypothetical protein